MKTVNIHEAKAHLSKLLDCVEAGESVVIARRNKPIAKLLPLVTDAPKKAPRTLGLADGCLTVSNDFFNSMTEEELAEWYNIAAPQFLTTPIPYILSQYLMR